MLVWLSPRYALTVCRVSDVHRVVNASLFLPIVESIVRDAGTRNTLLFTMLRKYKTTTHPQH